MNLCIPWDPIPHEYNRLSDLVVGDLAETNYAGAGAVALTINAFLPDQWHGPWHEWRLYLLDASAYLVHGVGHWTEALPVTRPPNGWAVDGGHVAMWEVTASLLIAQTIAPHSREGVHHYVLMNHDIAYEFIAHRYAVEELGEVGSE